MGRKGLDCHRRRRDRVGVAREERNDVQDVSETKQGLDEWLGCVSRMSQTAVEVASLVSE